MFLRHALAFLAGAVSMYVVVHLPPKPAGAAEVPAGAAEPSAAPAPEARTVRDVAGMSEADKNAYIAELESALERAELQRAFAVGQLRGVEGTPQAWPASGAEAWRPEAFRRLLDQRLAALPEVEVVSVDCEEFPCVALLRSRSTAADWVAQLSPVHDHLETVGFGDDIAVMGAAAEVAEDGQAPQRLYAWGVAPGSRDDAVSTRLQSRLQSTLQEATQAP